MGASQCKCACDDSVAQGAIEARHLNSSAYAEDVERKEPRIKTSEPPPERTGGEEAGTERKPLAPEVAKPADEAGCMTLEFELEAGKSLAARFSEISEPKASGGTLVATSIDGKSALATTKSNYVGLCPGDAITQVNGQSGDKSRLLELLSEAKKAGGKLVIQVRPRSPTFIMQLQKTGDEKLGIVVAVHTEINDRVEIRQVSDNGAVPTWNERNYMNQVVIGDWITAVNGQVGKEIMVQVLQECWKEAKPVSITVSTYPTQEQRSVPKS